MRNSIFGFNTGIQFRTGYQNQAKSSLEQGRVSGAPAAHPHQNFCSVPPPPPDWNCIELIMLETSVLLLTPNFTANNIPYQALLIKTYILGYFGLHIYKLTSQ